MFPVKNRKCECNSWILHIWISLGTKFKHNLTVLNFSTNFLQKSTSVQNWKKWTTTKFCIFEFYRYQPSAETNNFYFFFRSIFTKNGICSQNHKKWTGQPNYVYLNQSRYRISVEINNFGFLDQNCSSGAFQVKIVHTMIDFFILKSF